MIATILDVASKLFGLKDLLANARRDRRDRIADYSGELSNTRAAVVAMLRKGEIPHGKCQEMLVYAQTLPATVGDEIGKVQAEECVDSQNLGTPA